jgi:predicted dehydrogenase
MRVGVILNGVTGRMGTNQHLVGSILAIQAEGGVALDNGEVVWPEPILVGRNAEKVQALATAYGLDRWTTSLDEALADPNASIYFDAQTTAQRSAAVAAAIAAGKHVYCEKPLGDDLQTAIELARQARVAGVKNGVVQDKLFLPGLLKLRSLVESGALGRVLSVRGEFGYWVSEGRETPSQRPSWNYRRELGGGIILDMVPHWRYVLDNVIAPVRSISCWGAIHVPERFDENGQSYEVTAEDAAYATLELDGGIIAEINSSWCVRVNRDELLEFQVDGTEASAVAGLQLCKVQDRAHTPRAAWNPDAAPGEDFRRQWLDASSLARPASAFKTQWEHFLRHVAVDEPFPWDFAEGAKGVQLAELAMQSWSEGRRLEVPELDV